MWYQYLSVAFYGWSREETESVEVDSELDTPGKPNWGLTHQPDGPLPSLLRAGERRRVSGSASSKSNKKGSAKCLVRLRGMDSMKYVMDKERDIRK